MTHDRPGPLTTQAPVRGEPVSVELMNTVFADREGLHDALATAGSATAWLHEVEDRLPQVAAGGGRRRASLTAPDTARLRVLRDALRVVAANLTTDPRTVAHAGNAGRSVDEAVATINAAAERLPARLLRRTRDGYVGERRAADAHVAVFAGFAVDAVPLLAGDHEAGQLRACLAPGCVLYFVQDHPRREWCSPACGNRARVARHYARTQSRRADPSRS
jgi:predicted RNA-binding Zn ribbon-like protein